MRRLLLSVMFFFGIVGSVQASEYCLDRYNDRIANVDASLAASLKRLDQLQTELIRIKENKDGVSKAMAAVIKDDPTMQKPETREKLATLAAQFDTLDRQETSAKGESFELQDKIAALRGIIPADLQGELRGCIEAVKPANTTVNTVIQALAILTTGGGSLALPEKSLYVDMGQVLNGYPFGGDKALVVKAREDVLNALGLGGENNDIGKTVRDPGRVIRCLFGC